MKRLVLKTLVGILLFAVTLNSSPQPFSQTAQAKEAGEEAPWAETTNEFVPGQLLVRFKPGTLPARVEDLLATYGATRLKALPAIQVVLLQLPADLNVDQAVAIYNRLPEVEFAEPNYIFQIAESSLSWQDNQWAPQLIQAEQAWEQIPNPIPALIAVIDTGVDYRHSQLLPNLWSNAAEQAGQTGVDDDLNGYIDDLHGWDFYNNDNIPLDDHFHGTHVAGIAAATTGSDPNSMTGICPFCRILPVKVMGADGSGSLDAIASGILYAANNGARVINMSLGATAGTSTLQNAVDFAWNHGVVVIAAAGNNGANTLLYPAAYSNSVAVASTNSSEERSCFSNYGSAALNYISVAAPGEAIYSTTPLDGQGNDTYATYSGTSMATPHAAGLAGLLFAQNPGRTNAEVRQILQNTTNDLGPQGTDPYFGSGRINAYRAVMEITAPTLPPDGIYADSLTASGYAHARKLARDASGTLHLVWHSKDGSQYRVRYATSSDNGVTWTAQPDVYTSQLETYHPAVAVDALYLYTVFPSKTSSTNSYYQILFSRKSLSGGAWSPAVPVVSGSYNAVRPDIFLDPANGKLHVVASSLDDAPYVYYTASADQGMTWSPVHPVNPTTPTTLSNTRYASVHANGDHIYIATRTVAQAWLLATYYLHTVRSTDGGASWFDQTKISSYQALLSGEYGVSLAGVGDRLYMAYEVGGGLYFRRFDGSAWSNYEQLETTGAWPSISQAVDGQAWLVWQNGDNLLVRHYTGSTWEPAQNLFTGNALNKLSYPNLKLSSSGGRVDYVAASCSGAPFRLVSGGFPAGGEPTPTPTFTPVPTSTDTPTAAPTQTATYTPTPTAAATATQTNTPTLPPTSTATNTPEPSPSHTPTQTPTSTPTHTPTPSATATQTSTPTFTPTKPVSTDTGFTSPSAGSPNVTGDKNGFQLEPGYAFLDDGYFAVDVDSGTDTSTSCTSKTKDSHDFYAYSFSLPTGVAIQGIQVRMDAKADSASNTPKMCVQLSWDGGQSWTPARTTAALSTKEAAYLLGSSADLWGRIWSISDFQPGNFRVRIIDIAKSKTRDFYLDWVAVKVTYR